MDSYRTEDQKGFSTRGNNSLSRVSSERSFHQYRKSHTERSPACNMNDSERRIKREHTHLYTKSTQETQLF